MQKFPFRFIGLLIIVLTVVSSCKTNEFASNSIIQKRKHLKGYHLNFLPKKESITANQPDTNKNLPITVITSSSPIPKLAAAKPSTANAEKENNSPAKVRESSPVPNQINKAIVAEGTLRDVKFNHNKSSKLPALSMGAMASDESNDVIALLSMIFGICSVLFLFTPLALLSLLLSPAAIILGFIGLDSSRKGMAIAGIVTGFVLVLLIILVLILFISFLALI